MKKQGPLKICAGASAGGHMNQLLKLLEMIRDWPQRPSFYITTLEELAEKLAQQGPVYIIGECNRQHPFKALQVFIRSLRIVMKERPDVVITTGSLPLALLCLSAKLFGAKIVWIDSIANIESFSLSGRITLLFADLFLTQWPELANGHKNVEYAGAIV
ncbi:MAG: PssD/Cps14F family polysaccharide biosynthesis glycosyltransferase [Phycisphaerales bacterium]|jgi:UDP-N-acetylglucosamine:LPS N-acetylglucosamine transferase